MEMYKCTVCGKVMSFDEAFDHRIHEGREHFELQSEADTLRAENAKLREALKKFESLTPGGSEFADDWERIFKWVKERSSFVTEVAIQRNQYRDDLARLRELLGEINENLQDAIDLARTGLAPIAMGVNEVQWMNHKIYKLTGGLVALQSRIQSELKGICSECGGTGEVQWDYDDPNVEATVKAKAPCPKCQSELKE